MSLFISFHFHLCFLATKHSRTTHLFTLSFVFWSVPRTLTSKGIQYSVSTTFMCLVKLDKSLWTVVIWKRAVWKFFKQIDLPLCSTEQQHEGKWIMTKNILCILPHPEWSGWLRSVWFAVQPCWTLTDQRLNPHHREQQARGTPPYLSDDPLWTEHAQC